jgi:tRNA (mo5U34)-methyltransferase
MTSWTVRLLGLRASLVMSGDRVGFEMSLPAGSLKRGVAGMLAQKSARQASAAMAPEPIDPDLAELARQVAGVTWYQSIDLGRGFVTPGFYDHRPILERYSLPERLDGMRVLDVATFDGFWAFEFERRGAAEILALDVDCMSDIDLPFRRRALASEEELAAPFGQGFSIAHAARRSRVQHVSCNVYDLTPERFGRFDFVHVGDLLLHLRDPALALSRIRNVTSRYAFISDVIYPDLDRFDDQPIMQYDGGAGENIWWRFGARALRRMIEDAGFDQVEELNRFRYGPRGKDATLWHVIYRATP